MQFHALLTLSLLRACAGAIIALCSGSGITSATEPDQEHRRHWRQYLTGEKARSGPPISGTRHGAIVGSMGTVVPRQFFGMHVEQQFDVGWPPTTFSSQRLWDVHPAVSWEALNPSKGYYNWTPLDRLVEDSRRKRVDLVYVFGRVPRWASSKPDGACEGNTSGSCYPPDIAAWRDFVSRITSRYRQSIQYWELWNEPDARSFWTGTVDQLVALSKEAYPLVKATGGTVLSPSPQGMAGPRWMEAYLRAGGAPFSDINSFHGYVGDAPEALNGLVSAYRAVFERFGIDHRELWDTEHSWGHSKAPLAHDHSRQAAWLARFQILSADSGIDRSFWYGWHHPGWGTLFDKETRKVLAPGMAYGELHQWLRGSAVGPCRQRLGIFRCPIRRTGHGAALALWSTDGNSLIEVPLGFHLYRRIDGTVGQVQPAQTLTIGSAPILLERRVSTIDGAQRR